MTEKIKVSLEEFSETLELLNSNKEVYLNNIKEAKDKLNELKEEIYKKYNQ